MRIFEGDVRTVLPQLPANSVQCVVTSPPYWGLRDYGTGQWEGGDPACDHKPTTSQKQSKRVDGNMPANTNHALEGYKGKTCPQCGAVRNDSQLGLEATPEEYIANMVAVFREIRRVLRDDGTLWLNMGDSYASGTTAVRPPSKSGTAFGWTCEANVIPRNGTPPGFKTKDLIGMPWMLALALRADSWWLRSDIIWSKPNPMPESVNDRPTKAHEYIFLLAKSERYFYDAIAVREEGSGQFGGNKTHKYDALPGHETKHGLLALADTLFTSRHKRTVWTVNPAPFPEAHFATFPEELITPCILAGTSEKGCCSKCGAPWVRIVESERSDESGSGKSGNLPIGKMAGGTQVREDHDVRMGPTVAVKTLGWGPQCGCMADIVKCVVLDPFFGSGTTGVVGKANHCEVIGVELNPEYIEIAKRRLRQDVLF